jgi:hypothetical protein
LRHGINYARVQELQNLYLNDLSHHIV